MLTCTKKDKSWLSLVSFVKEKLNLFPVAYNRNDTIKHIPTYEIVKYLINIYKTHFVGCLTEDDKLALYAQVKKFGLEKYSNLITNSRERQAVTKMRISAHSLPIETGRYKGIDTNDRICPLSYQDVGYEAHYFTKCQNNTNNLFTRKLIDIKSAFTLKSCENIFLYIMSTLMKIS